MGKAGAKKRTTKIKSDPVMDQLSAVSAKSLLVGNIINMGWRLGIMVLGPIFIGVQLDKKFDSSPSLTLAAFFIAIFGSSLLIYRTYSEMNAATEIIEAKKAKRLRARILRKLKRKDNA